MKILLVSMNSIHFRRWSDQLRDSGFDLYWFDILDQGYAPSMSWMTQITGWKKGFLKKRGRSILKSKLPKLFNALVHKYDNKVEDAFANALQEIQPDLVHSFALYISASPILSVMLKNSIPWIYSSWGSDLFYYKNKPDYLKDIQAVLPRVNYMFADCKRDQQIANELGFNGTHLGVFPGGGGFDLELIENYKIPFENRKIIAVKGNHNRSGRALQVLKALEQLGQHIDHLEVIVFGATNPLILDFETDQIKNLTIKAILNHDQILELFGESLIYIGNSNSDGMPNTLLEAICAGAFPIQSNPGGATAELIENGTNGLLIEECEDVKHIQAIIHKAISNKTLLEGGVAHNTTHILPMLSRYKITQQVIKAYTSINC
ncbi:glycosyltransferase family 4 protein [Nonlabens mediterrranea]|uniref:Glycosyltransferase family 4 protein n=1 Tax=Nonlabens mediterrranea TaxID=1419947 RepID=A0ABS0A9B9_9FLAO|nr:glycosyltransferase family 4 protein [Nonlabens mediterrranea]